MTDVPLKEHLEMQLAELSRRVTDGFAAQDRLTQLALASAEKAVAKAETAADKRFDAVNEFRGQLTDQAAQFLPRETFDSVIAGWTLWRADIDRRLSEQTGAGRVERRAQDRGQPWRIWAAGAILGLLLVAFSVGLTVVAMHG